MIMRMRPVWPSRADARNENPGNSFCGGNRFRRDIGWQAGGAGPLQRINHRGLGGMVGGLVVAAGDADRPVGGVVVGKVFLVFATVRRGLLAVAEPGVELREVEVRRKVFRI